VIPRKDMPQIHTMCLPINELGGPSNLASVMSTFLGSSGKLPPAPAPAPVSVPATSAPESPGAGESDFLRQGYADLAESRMEVTRQVRPFPQPCF